MQNLNKTEKEIVRKLQEFEQKASGKLKGDTPWTKGIKSALADLGEELGYTTCAGGIESCESEWLYDLTWYKEEGEGDNKRLIEVPLIMESEWNLDFKQIKYDFEKLLVSNAPNKLMICNAGNARFKFLKNYFLDAVKNYKHLSSDTRILIAILDVDDETFEFVHIVNGSFTTLKPTYINKKNSF